METTAGQVLINDALPPDLRDYARTLDKKGLQQLFTQLAEKYPDKYAEINQRLHQLGVEASTTYGGVASLSLDALRTPESVRKLHKELNDGVQGILAGKQSKQEKDEQIVQLLSKYIEPITEANYDDARKNENPFALQIMSGSRGNKNQFRSLRGGDVLLVDHRERPIPIPVLNSYSEGLDPVQYWAGAYGARRGQVAVKFATPKAGFLGKQLSLAAHRLLVTEKDCGTTNGIAVTADDPDNEGAVMSDGQVLTPKLSRSLGDKSVIVRSPMTCRAEQGVCQKCVGIRERGTFPPIGENVGVAAAQAVVEPLSQSALGTKHSGGQAKAKAQVRGGLDLINQLVQVPTTFQGAAAIATTDGTVEGIDPAPQGGSYVTIGGVKHWAAPELELSIKKGDTVEAGDILSDGLPNPAQVVQYKGIGEGRRYFMDLFHKSLKDSGAPAHRRNVELLARGLINHVRITDPDGPSDTTVDDVVEYDDIVRGYQPRFGFKVAAPKAAKGLYLEEPVLHYSIGTRLTPKVVKQLEDFKIPAVKAHADAPSFAPEMTRAMETLMHSSDWMTRLGGFHLKKGLTEAVHHNRTSDTHGTSFIPALAQGTEFGKPPSGKGY